MSRTPRSTTPTTRSAMTSTATITQILGGSTRRADARPISDLEKTLAGVPKAKRKDLSVTELQKLKSKAEDGLENKFMLMAPFADTKANKDQLESIYSITMRVEEFHKSLQAFDMDDVFNIASEYVDEVKNDVTYKIPGPKAAVINLLTMHSKVDLDTVKHASEFVALQGDADFLVQNLIWSGTKLLNSCDDKLRTKIEEKTLDWPVQHTTGPVYFKIMIDNILASTPESMRGLTTILQETKLSDYNGENVTEYVSFARGAIEQLRNNHALPTDVLWLISKALRACETPEFVSYLTTMYNNHVQHVKPCTVDDMMLAAETEYVSMVSAKL